MSPEKQSVLTHCRKLRAESERLARDIWEASELPLMETRSATATKQALLDHGFTLGREFPLIPNAFVATFGHGKPVIGLLAEYDALPDCGPEARVPGHGCGHNLLGAGSTFAAIAAAQALAQAGLPGTVKLFGCPAEETLVGKAYMARDGAFDHLDACLAWHPGSKTNVNNGSGTAMDSLTYEFYGKTAHAAGNPHDGRSALDAVEIMNIAVNFLREHVPENIRMHYAIMDGGKAPNVVPAYARSWYYVRGKDRPEVAAISARVHNCAKAAALATDTKMKRTVLTVCYDRVANDAIAQAMDANLKAVGAPRFTKADEAVALELGITGKLNRKLGEIKTSRNSGSSDEANVSWLTPLSVLSVACWAEETPGHNVLVHEQVATPPAMKGLAVTVQTLALTAFDLLTDRKLLTDATKEFRRRVKGHPYDAGIPMGQRAPLQDRIP
jgi:aminobenzoyl-glutamate utilization protein B